MAGALGTDNVIWIIYTPAHSDLLTESLSLSKGLRVGLICATYSVHLPPGVRCAYACNTLWYAQSDYLSSHYHASMRQQQNTINISYPNCILVILLQLCLHNRQHWNARENPDPHIRSDYNIIPNAVDRSGCMVNTWDPLPFSEYLSRHIYSQPEKTLTQAHTMCG